MDVDADEADDGHGDMDRDGDGVAQADRVMDGTVSLPGTTDSVLISSRSESSAAFAGLETMMDSEAAVTSWVKLAGPLVLAAVGFSCLVDHWRRCW